MAENPEETHEELTPKDLTGMIAAVAGSMHRRMEEFFFTRPPDGKKSEGAYSKLFVARLAGIASDCYGLSTGEDFESIPEAYEALKVLDKDNPAINRSNLVGHLIIMGALIEGLRKHWPNLPDKNDPELKNPNTDTVDPYQFTDEGMKMAVRSLQTAIANLGKEYGKQKGAQNIGFKSGTLKYGGGSSGIYMILRDEIGKKVTEVNTAARESLHKEILSFRGKLEQLYNIRVVEAGGTIFGMDKGGGYREKIKKERSGGRGEESERQSP